MLVPVYCPEVPVDKVNPSTLEYAKRLMLTADQARHEVGLPERYRVSVRIGGRIALWEGFLPARMVASFVTAGQFYRVPDSPEYSLIQSIWYIRV